MKDLPARLVSLTPSNQIARPKDRTRVVLTRSKAKDVLSHLKEDFPREGAALIHHIDYELKHSQDDTHIAFYIDNTNSDAYVAFQCVCVDVVTTYLAVEIDRG